MPDEVWLLVCVLLILGGLALIVFLVIRAQHPVELPTRFARAEARPGTGQGPHSIEPGEDGFWFDAGWLETGSVVHYRYQTTAGTQEGTWTMPGGPARQFVYTGAQPRDIEILRVERLATSQALAESLTLDENPVNHREPTTADDTDDECPPEPPPAY